MLEIDVQFCVSFSEVYTKTHQQLEKKLEYKYKK